MRKIVPKVVFILVTLTLLVMPRAWAYVNLSVIICKLILPSETVLEEAKIECLYGFPVG